MKNHRRRKPVPRLKGFDYSSDAIHFVTTNVRHFVSCLGTIKDGIMTRNESGDIVQQTWEWLAQQYPYVILHEFVVMPDHFHGLIQIDSSRVEGGKIKPLSELMGAFKTVSSKHIRLAGNTEFRWHRSFYARIVRNARAYECITRYIAQNPERYQSKRLFFRRVSDEKRGFL